MKLSVSVSGEDVDFIDRYAGDHGVDSRSGVVQRALALLRASELGDDYAEAWAEWDRSEADLWEAHGGRRARRPAQLMRRGDVVWVDLDPARAGEANKRGPAVVVSNDGANRTARSLGRGVVTVVPVTSRTARVFPFQVLLPARSCGLPRASKAQAEQIRSVSVERIGAVVGHLPPDLDVALDEAIRLHLGL